MYNLKSFLIKVHTIADLTIGEQGVIESFSFDEVPLQLLEMGCYPGKEVELIQIAPLNDPLYIRVNDSHIAIRRDTAEHIILAKRLCDDTEI